VRALAKQLDRRLEEAVVSIGTALDQAPRQRPQPLEIVIRLPNCGFARRRHTRAIPPSRPEKHAGAHLADEALHAPESVQLPFCSRARTSPCSASSRLLIASARRRPCASRVEAARTRVRVSSAAGGSPTGSSRIDASTVRSLSRRSRAMIDASILIPSERRRTRIARVDARGPNPAGARSATLADCTKASRSRRERRVSITIRWATPGEPEARRCRRSRR
jgi:hypothetical protein